MNFLIALVSLALLIALPIGVIMLVYRLVDTRNDGRVAKGESAPPWSDGLYSAAKRATPRQAGLGWICSTLDFVVVGG